MMEFVECYNQSTKLDQNILRFIVLVLAVRVHKGKACQLGKL